MGPPKGKSEPSTFIRGVASELREAPALAATLAAGVTLGGVGHAGMALAAGLLLSALHRGAAGGGGLGPIEAAHFGLLCALVKGGGAVAVASATASVSARAATRLRRRAVEALWETRDGGGPAALARVTLRTREVELAITGAIPGLAASIQLAALTATLIAVSGALTLVTLGALLPLGLVLGWLRRGLRRRGELAQDRTERLLGDLDGLLRHVDLWRVQGARTALDAALAQTAKEAERAATGWERARVGLSSLNEALAAAAILAVVAWAPGLGLPLTDARVVTSLGLALLAYRPLRDLGEARGWAARGASAMEALAPWANPTSAAASSARGNADAPAGRAQGDAPLTGKWEPAELALTGFASSLHGAPLTARWAAGSLVAIVGPTGCGKTSLLRALLGLDAATGELRHGARDLAAAGVGPAARPFGWVPQEAQLLPGTLVQNVLVGAADGAAVETRGAGQAEADHARRTARARAALDAVGAAPLLDALGDTPLGSGQRGLSGGQRRLVALARALAGPAPVLLLDEPTEGLDHATEARVMAHLAALRGQRTLVIASHRPAVEAIADVVVRFMPAPAPLASDHQAGAGGSEPEQPSPVPSAPAPVRGAHGN